MAHEFKRGARPTPRHKLLAAPPFRPVTTPLPQFAVVPPKLDPWDNNVDGVCVSSEEAFAKAWWSTYCGLTETFATSAEVRSFAAKHGWLNGANLSEVMDVMISEGMTIGGTVYKDGGYMGVDYSNDTVLQSAIDPTDGTGGPVKIAIDANALPSGAGNQQGWYATSKGNYGNTDHCVGIGGYGKADYLFDQLKVTLPSGLSASTPGYHLYTWATIGFVTHDWLMGTCTEAWVRNPTTIGQTPTPVPPGPTPGPTPVPPGPVTMLDLTLEGFVNGPLGRMPVKLSGTAVPHQARASSANWLAVIGDIGTLVTDYRNNATLDVIEADAAKLLRDLGLMQQISGSGAGANWFALFGDAARLVADVKGGAGLDVIEADAMQLVRDLGLIRAGK